MRIVVVEDETPIRNGMGNILSKISESYEVVGKAADGREGLELIRKEQPDLVILDIRMPEMDGLEMLEILRKEGNSCKVIILSAYSDFSYAKTAIGLGIENYLLKPIKLAELKNSLELVEQHLQKEAEEKKRYTLDKVMWAAVNGQLEQDDYLAEQLEKQEGFQWDQMMAVLEIWLGEDYGKYSGMLVENLRELGQNSGLFRNHTFPYETKQMVLVILYEIGSMEQMKQYLKRTVAPMVYTQTGGKAVTGLHVAAGVDKLQKSVQDLYQALDYNLTCENGRLIDYEEMNRREWKTYKYPLELEQRTKQALFRAAEHGNASVEQCIWEFVRYCRQGGFHPAEAKEGCVKFFHAVYVTAKECGRIQEGDLLVSELLQKILGAVTWDVIVENLVPSSQETVREEGESLLVRKAEKMIRDYYSQGITLEEISRKLGVSEEYLSARFRKETGRTFTETMKRCRIEKIKELLISTNLKLNQIAEKAGYSDPKYMSKSFKEETGMLPLEYRKIYM